MKSWLLSLFLIAAGTLCVLWGIAWHSSPYQVGRWMPILLLGLPFLLIGLAQLLRCDPHSVIRFHQPGQERTMVVLAVTFILAGTVGSYFAIRNYPSAFGEEWAEQAPWLKWCFAAILWWFAAFGTAMIVSKFRKLV